MLLLLLQSNKCTTQQQAILNKRAKKYALCYLLHNYLLSFAYSGIACSIFTQNGEGFFLRSPSEFERFSSSARFITKPACAVEIAEGVRPPPPEPEPEPEPEQKEEEAAAGDAAAATEGAEEAAAATTESEATPAAEG